MRNPLFILLGVVCLLTFAVGLRELNTYLSEEPLSSQPFRAQVSPGPNEALYFVSPSSGTHNVNSTFQVELRMSASAGVTSIKAYLNYNPSLIQVSSMQTSLTTFSAWWEDSFDNVNGRLRFQASAPVPGFSGNNALLATITLQAMGQGTATLTYDPGSLALKPDDTNILNIAGSTTGTYALVVPDTTPPSRFNGAPTGTLAAGTASTNISLTTSENATCRYSTTQNTAYSSMTNTFSTTGGTAHSTAVSGLSNGNSFAYYVRCQDSAGNPNISDFPIEFSVGSPTPPPDTTPPSRSSGSPSGTLNAGATQTTLQLATDEAATCRYSTTQNTAYDSMVNTFSTTGGTSHSTTVSNLSDGQSYSYYVRCQDALGNANATDFPIEFSVASPPASPPPSSGGGGGGGGGGGRGVLPPPSGGGGSQGDCNRDGKVDVFDVSILLRNWEKPNADLSCDFNGDRSINVFDASIMLRNWTR